MKIVIISWFILFNLTGICQEKNILDCMRLIDFKLEKYNHSDNYPTDTIIDLAGGYYDIYIKDAYSIDGIYYNTSLCQIAQFKNMDGTITLGVTGYYGDMQCSNHPSYFYEISKSGKEIIPIENSNILPSLNWMDFLNESESVNILKKYLPTIQESYLDSSATIEDVLGEVYDIHYILPRKGTTIKAALTVCDYIPRNQVSIPENDWKIITEDFKTIKLNYDKRLKKFGISDSKK